MTEFHLDTFLTRIGIGNINAEWVDRFEASLIVSKCVDFDGMRVNWPRLDSVIKSLASLMFWLHLARCLFTRVVHSFVAVWAGRWSGWSAAGHTSTAARRQISDWDGNRSTCIRSLPQVLCCWAWSLVVWFLRLACIILDLSTFKRKWMWIHHFSIALVTNCGSWPHGHQ